MSTCSRVGRESRVNGAAENILAVRARSRRWKVWLLTIDGGTERSLRTYLNQQCLGV